MPNILDSFHLVLDSKVKIGLLSLFRDCKRPEVIPILFQAIAVENSDISRAAIDSLRERKLELQKEMLLILGIAEKLVEHHSRLALNDRIALWRIDQNRSEFRDVIQFLPKRNRRKVRTVH
jgi:hypothetical protein